MHRCLFAMKKSNRRVLYRSYTPYCVTPAVLCRLCSGCLGGRLCCLHCCSSSEVCMCSHRNCPAGKHTSPTQAFLDRLYSLKPCRSIMVLCVFVHSAGSRSRHCPGRSVRHLEGHHTCTSARPGSCQGRCQGSQRASGA